MTARTNASLRALRGALAVLVLALGATACAGTQEDTSPPEPKVNPDGSLEYPPGYEPEPEPEPEVPDGAEHISFEGMDAEGPEDKVGGIAPRRKKIEPFKLYGQGGRGGPGGG